MFYANRRSDRNAGHPRKPPSKKEIKKNIKLKHFDKYLVGVKIMGMYHDDLRLVNLPANIPVYQFLIVIRGIEPKIWRRVQVPSDYNFYHFHLLIRKVMTWNGCHLHYFRVKDKMDHKKVLVGQPVPPPFHNATEAFFGPPSSDLIDEKYVRIDTFFKQRKDQAVYLYDFGDRWEHKIWLEEILTPEEGVYYPRCITGKRSRPPEDAGGPHGYDELLKILQDKKHSEHKERLEWLNFIGMKNFDPEQFNANNLIIGVDDNTLNFFK